MPRLTRSVLSSPARSSPRETTKASSKSSTSPAPKTRHGAKASELEEEKVTRRQSKEKGTGDAVQRRKSGRRGSTEPSEESETKTRSRGGSAVKAKKQQKNDEKEEEEPAARGKSRGRGTKKQKKDEEEDEPEEEETTPRGRSRGRGARQTKKEDTKDEEEEKPETGSRRKRGSKQQTAEEEEEEQGVTGETPSPASRKRGAKGKQQKEEETQEADVKDSDKTPTRRGRGRLSQVSTPSPAASRSRSRKQKPDDSEAMEVEEAKEESTPRRRSKKAETTETKTPDISPSPRGRRGRTPKESPDVPSGRRGRSSKKDEEEEEEEVSEEMDTKESAKDDAQELEAPSLQDERTTDDKKSQAATVEAEPPSIEQEAPSIHLQDVSEPSKKEGTDEMPAIEPEPMATEEELTDKKEKGEDKLAPGSIATATTDVVDTPEKKSVEEATTVKVTTVTANIEQENKTDTHKVEDLSTVHKADIPSKPEVVVEQKKSETTVTKQPAIQPPVVEDISAEEEEGEDVPEPKGQEPKAFGDKPNGAAVEKSEAVSSVLNTGSSKRKFEEDVSANVEEISSKRARVNGDEAAVESAEATCADVEMVEDKTVNEIPQAVQEPSQSDAKPAQPVVRNMPGVSSENEASAKTTNKTKTEEAELDILNEYVVISEKDIPPPDSQEVADAAPKKTALSTVEAASTSTDQTEAASYAKKSVKSSGIDEMVSSTQAMSAPVRDMTSSSVGSSSAEATQSSVVSKEVSQQISEVSSQAADLGGVPSSFVSDSSTAEAMEVDNPAFSSSVDPADSSVTKVNTREPVSTSEANSVTNTNNLYSPKQLAQVNSVDQTPNSQTVFPTAGTSHDIFHRTFLPNPSIPLNSTDVSHRFSIVSYNILADSNLRKPVYDYTYTEPQFLEQDFRHKLLIEELRYLDSDIVCMQEVSPDYFKSLLEPAMNSLGYQGGMMKRTIDEFKEGEATFFKINRFSLIDSQGISLTELAYKEIDEAGLTDEVKLAAQNYVKKADVAYISQLRCNFTHKTVTIGNVHIVWDDHKHPDVQCIQIACAVKEVVNRAGSNEAAHVICGDFNTNSTSPGYQLACDGYLSDDSLTRLQAIEKLELADGSKSLVNQVWRAFQHTSSTLRSAYAAVQKNEPTLTTFTNFYHDAVDYVFHNSTLETLGVLETVNASVIDATGGLPSKSFPSDHVSLKAELSFKD